MGRGIHSHTSGRILNHHFITGSRRFPHLKCMVVIVPAVAKHQQCNERVVAAVVPALVVAAAPDVHYGVDQPGHLQQGSEAGRGATWGGGRGRRSSGQSIMDHGIDQTSHLQRRGEAGRGRVSLDISQALFTPEPYSRSTQMHTCMHEACMRLYNVSLTAVHYSRALSAISG